MTIKINIAMDGPAGSGKTTVGRLLSKKLDYKFLDSGMLYRHFAYFCQQNNPQLEKSEELISAWKKWLEDNEESLFSYLEDERERLNSPQINNSVSQLSQFSELRKIILEFQRKLTQKKGWVVVGRDITSEVLPHAEIKIFLTASLDERAKRRSKEYKLNLNYKDLKKELQKRDYQDKTRKISPLIITNDSWVLDTTHLSPEEIVKKILIHYNQKLGN